MPVRRKPNFFYNHIKNPQDLEEVKRIFDRAYTKSLKFLSYRPRSEKEVSDFLKKKEFDEEVIANVLELLKNQQFLNDPDFAIWWTEQRQRSSAKGKTVIKQELRAKGIEEDTINQTLQDSQDDLETARKLFEKKRSRFERYSGDEYKQKVAGFLSRRGFGWDIIKQILKRDE